MSSYDNIRIGTLVSGGNGKAADYIRQINHHGFESYSITFWQNTEVTDWDRFAKETREAAEEAGAIISTVSPFGNPLETTEIDLQTLKLWEDCIDNAHLFGAKLVTGFAGRLRDKSIPESIPRFKEIFTDLCKRAEDKGVKIAFENCDMGGDWHRGDWNIAHNPSAWELMFNAVPFDNIGLEWEPCHQMVSLMDPMPQLRKWIDKVFHVHGKDATIHWDLIKEFGIHTKITAENSKELGLQQVPSFVEHRTPGFGDSNWTDIITELRRNGYTSSIDIEGWHDPVYCGDLEMTGQVHALNYLKNCRGGSYVQNPNT
ncbi:MAG: sugar phosphate isomerase/epimerase [Lentisphaeria bacterium]|nr:sugar phosphate isomerase/epimerase [Lentisphaeria bacterium]